MIKLLILGLLILTPVTALTLHRAKQSPGRFAVTHDGNYHDKDDIGAVAMVEALVWKAGAQDRLVHLDHSNHRGANDVEQHDDMILSTMRFLSSYGINKDIVFDDVIETRQSVLNLASEIEKSTARDRLTIIQAGPWEFMALAFDYSDPSKHQYVTILSHSFWNDDHQHEPHHRNRVDFFAQYNDGDQFEGFKPPTYLGISDQNSHAFRSPLNAWQWLLETPETNFVLHRTTNSGFAQGDMSDAGMVFYYLTGNSTPTMQDIQEFFNE